jgi:hypothetical protein
MESLKLNLIIDQISIQGGAFQHDISQLYSIGVPVYKLLEKYTDKSISELKECKIIDTDTIIKALNKGGFYN